MNKVSVYIPKKPNIKANIGDVRVIEHGISGDYNDLKNKPTLNGVEIVGDKTAEDYGITPGGDVISDYSMLSNLPSINEHVLSGGENSLASLGINKARNTDINKLF